MKLVRYTSIISPHQLPQAIEFARIVGENEFRYIYAQPVDDERVQMGWGGSAEQTWLMDETQNRQQAREILESCEILISGICDLDLFESRVRRGLKTFYVSERWFKPFQCGGFQLSGRLRLLHPRYLLKALRLRRLVRTNCGVVYLAMGTWAARDMAWLCGWGKTIRCESLPGAQVSTPRLRDRRIFLWGYFVAPTTSRDSLAFRGASCGCGLRVLWCGRLLGWKRVLDIILALKEIVEVQRMEVFLTIVGEGSEKARLMKLAKGLPITFLPSQPIAKIRTLMRQHDVYVLSSNQYEGWGAVVNEALIEGMRVIGTYEAGASATMLPESALYHAGDWHTLAEMIAAGAGHTGIGAWSVTNMKDAYGRITEMRG